MEKEKRMQFTMCMWTCMSNGTFSHLDEGLFSTVSWLQKKNEGHLRMEWKSSERQCEGLLKLFVARQDALLRGDAAQSLKSLSGSH